MCKSCGRGMRPHPSKKNTLVLDFAGNTLRLGPVNDPVIPARKGEGKGDAPIRICDNCACINHAAARVCKNCGNEFPPPRVRIEEKAYSTELIKRKDMPQINAFPVDYVTWNKHMTRNGNEIVKIVFISGKYMFNMYLDFNPEHKSNYNSSLNKWKKFGYKSNPVSAEDALTLMGEGFKKPDAVKIWLNKPHKTSTGLKKIKEVIDVIYIPRDESY